MPSGVYIWSQTSGSNGNADSEIGMAEGMAPSAVNDGIRALMAVIKKHDDDISGAITTGGSLTAYTVTSYSSFDSLVHLNGQLIAFTPHATNGATVTLNVDGLGAKPLRTSPGVELLAGMLIQGTPYVALYNSSDAVWYIRGFTGNPYNVPLGGGMIYTGSTAPNSSFVFPYGQAVSRSIYATYFSLVSTTYGTGDGSTTFNVPDLRGRVIAGKDDMGGSSANRLTAADDGLNGDTLGATGGGETQTLVTGNLPAYTPAGSIANGAITVSGGSSGRAVAGDNNNSGGGGGTFSAMSSTPLSLSASQAGSTFTGTAQGGTSAAFGIVQPTIILNYILRIV